MARNIFSLLGCLAILAATISAADDVRTLRIVSSIDSTELAAGASFDLSISVTALERANSPVIVMVSLPLNMNGGVDMETVSVSGEGRGASAPATYCGAGVPVRDSIDSAGDPRGCFILQWPSVETESDSTAVLRITPKLPGMFPLSVGVRAGSVDRIPSRQSPHEFSIVVSERDDSCSSPECDPARENTGVTHVSFIDANDASRASAGVRGARTQPLALTGPVTGIGIGVLGNAWSHIDTFYDDFYFYPYFLADITRRASAVGHSHGGLMRSNAAIETWHASIGDVMYDFDNVWSSPDQRAGVDAHVYAGAVYDYMLSQLGRNGFDDLGGTMKTTVDEQQLCLFIWCWGQSADNASWNGSSIRIGKGISGPSYAASLDAVAHEWGHGITQRVGGLEYQRESGALNEAFSDWFGTAVDWYYGRSNWTIAESSSTLRDLSNPLLYQHPDRYQGPYWVSTAGTCGSTNDNCGVHINSGVPNKMFYLLAAPGVKVHNGVAVTGLGVQEAMRLAYVANLFYWGQYINFSQARDGMVLAANSPFEATQVKNAWRAVGVNSAVQPDFLTPADGGVISNTILNFQWTPIANATRYELKVIEANTPQQFRVELLGGGSTSAIYTLPSGNYRAEVRACDNFGCFAPGITNFVINGGSVPSSAPSGITCGVSNDAGQNRLDCNWSALAGSHFYFVNVVQPGAGPGGGALTVAGRQVGGTGISMVLPNGNATVLVRGCTGDGCGPFSAGFPISPSFGNPTVPILGEPFSGSSVNAGSNAPNITFTWNRVAGDNGGNYKYRLYVQDFSRNTAALDVITTANFYGAYVNPGTRFDALVIALPVNGGPPRQGPASPFLTRGRVPRSPASTAPTYGSTVSRDGLGRVQVSWTPLVNSDGTVSTRRYQYFFAGPSQVGGVTTSTTAFPVLTPGNWLGIVRACTTGTNCVESSPAGWGPWNNEAGSEGGMASFTVQ